MFTTVGSGGRPSAREEGANIIGEGALPLRCELRLLPNLSKSCKGEPLIVLKLGRRLDGADDGPLPNGRWNLECLACDGTRPGLIGAWGVRGKRVLGKRSAE